MFNKFSYFSYQSLKPPLSPSAMPIQMTVMPAIVQQDDYYPNKSYQQKTKNDLYEDMKPLILFGRLFCIIPWSRSKHSWRKGLLGLGAIPILINVSILCILITSFYFAAKDLVQYGVHGRKPSVQMYYQRAQRPLGFLMETFVYFHFLRNSARFYKIFERWEQVNRQIPLERDKWLRRMSYLLVLYPLAHTAFMAHLYYDVSVKLNRWGRFTWLQMFQLVFWRSWKIPHKPEYAWLMFSFKMATNIATAFITPIIVVLSRVLSFQFKRLIEDASGTKVVDAHMADLSHKDKAFWRNIVERHNALSLLAKTINNFLSPLMFWWISYNIYFLTATLYRTLFGVTGTDMSKNLFFGSFAIETFQFLTFVVCASKVNTYAMKILYILRSCPKEHFYDTEVCRLEHFVACGPTIGFTGLGCFPVTRPFLIQIFNAVFTIEIILLQSVESSTRK